MKRYTLYNILLSGLLLAACSKEDGPSPVPDGADAFATVSVAVDGVAGTKVTKAESSTEPGNDTENAIKNLTVVFIDEANNEVIAHGFRKRGASDQDTTARVGLKTGTYKMLLIANTDEVASFDPAVYYALTTSLGVQGADKGFVMTNAAEEIEIQAGENKITGKTIKRIVGRVDLSKVAVDWQDNDLKQIKGLQFKLKQVFLANVRPQSYLFDTSLNKEAEHTIENKEGGYLCGIEKFYSGANSDIVAGNVYASYLNKSFDPAIAIKSGEDAVISNVASFYVMTNSDTKDNAAPVILYIKGDLYDSNTNKNVLTDRYYRIKLAKGVQRNTLYKIEATIQGKGSPEPGDNKENIDMSVTIIINTWDNVTLDKITIDEEIEI